MQPPAFQPDVFLIGVPPLRERREEIPRAGSPGDGAARREPGPLFEGVSEVDVERWAVRPISWLDRDRPCGYLNDQFTMGKTGKAPPLSMMFTRPIWSPFSVPA